MARVTKDNVDKFIEYDLDLDTKTLYMGSCAVDWEGYETGVDFAMIESVIKGLHVLDRIKPDTPIIIIMNNIGGDWYHGMGIYDFIRFCSSNVHIHVFGHAMSMGSVILQAPNTSKGDLRCMSPNSKFMIHYGTEGTYNHSKIAQKWCDEGKRVNHDMENIYLDKMLEKDEAEEGDNYLEHALEEIMTRQHELDFPVPKPFVYRFSSDPNKRREDVREVLQKMLMADTILTAEETVKIGLADEVLEVTG